MPLGARGAFNNIADDSGAASRLSVIIMSSFFLGSLTMIALATAVFSVRKGLRLKSTCVQLFSMATLYASTCVYFALSVIHYANVYSWDTLSLYIPYSHSLSSGWGGNILETQSWIFCATLTINVSVADAIVWWRACAVWPNNRRILVGCVSALTITLGEHYTNPVLGSISTYKMSLSGGEYVFGQGVYRRGLDIYGMTCFFILFLSNVASTSLIGYKAWEHRKILVAALNRRAHTSRVLAILCLLVESGTIYSILWLMLAIFYAYFLPLEDPSPGETAVLRFYDIVSGGAAVYLVAIYPMLVIVVVHISQTKLDAWTVDVGGTQSNSLHFADVGDGSQRSRTTQATVTHLREVEVGTRDSS